MKQVIVYGVPQRSGDTVGAPGLVDGNQCHVKPTLIFHSPLLHPPQGVQPFRQYLDGLEQRGPGDGLHKQHHLRRDGSGGVDRHRLAWPPTGSLSSRYGAAFTIFLVIFSGTVFPLQMFIVPLFRMYNDSRAV